MNNDLNNTAVKLNNLCIECNNLCKIVNETSNKINIVLSQISKLPNTSTIANNMRTCILSQIIPINQKIGVFNESLNTVTLLISNLFADALVDAKEFFDTAEDRFNLIESLFNDVEIKSTDILSCSAQLQLQMVELLQEVRDWLSTSNQ